MSASSPSSIAPKPVSSPKPKRAHASSAETSQPSSEISDERIIDLLREALRQGEVYDATATSHALKWHPGRLY
ncbi:hypothetical protein [Roseimicrobium gellanilyticum]|nr:hypothetical protein [Roseimicrobium gellanilyticum]